jgi:hypothetical protein
MELCFFCSLDPILSREFFFFLRTTGPRWLFKPTFLTIESGTSRQPPRYVFVGYTHQLTNTVIYLRIPYDIRFFDRDPLFQPGKICAVNFLFRELKNGIIYKEGPQFI